MRTGAVVPRIALPALRMVRAWGERRRAAGA
jgi:hypothetical protein